MLQLPSAPESNAVRVLAQQYRERLTGVVGVTLTLQYQPMLTVDGVGLEIVSKNGSVLDPVSDYSISGLTITLSVAAIAGDKFVVRYAYRT